MHDKTLAALVASMHFVLLYCIVRRSVMPCMELVSVSFLVLNAYMYFIMQFIPLYPDFPGRCLCNPFLEPLVSTVSASKVLALGFVDFKFPAPCFFCLFKVTNKILLNTL